MIPLVDLQTQYRRIENEIQQAVQEVLDSGHYVLGQQVSLFEKEFAAYCRSDYAVGVNSGTSALHLALLAGGVGPGDEVITVPFTFVATIAAILYAGARPVLVEIRPDTCTMDPEKVEAAISSRTKAIIAVHLYGQPVDMDPILEVARKHHLIVIEDAAQAHGAEYKGRRTGSIGDLGCFSFYPTKNLGACGEGGAVTTSSAEYNHVLRMLRDWGMEKKYQHKLRGFNYRLDTLQAAILRVKLKYLDQWNRTRNLLVHQYRSLLNDLPLRLLKILDHSCSANHLFPIFTSQRDALQKFLQEKGITTAIHYPLPVYLQPAYQDLGYRAGDFPFSEQAAQETLSLPLYPELSTDLVQQISEGVREFFEKH